MQSQQNKGPAAQPRRYNDIELAIHHLSTNTVDVVDLSKKRLTPDQVTRLSAALQKNTSLQELNLDHCELGGVATIASAVKKHPKLEVLNLGYNGIHTPSLNALAEVLESKESILKVLDLSNNPHADITNLANSLYHNQKLTTLNLGNCQLDDTQGVLLFTALKGNKTLRHLNVSENFIGDKAADQLIGTLKYNHSLFEVRMLPNLLSANKITEIREALAYCNQSYDILVREAVCGGLISNNIEPTTEYGASIFDIMPEMLEMAGSTYAAAAKVTHLNQREFSFYLHDKLKTPKKAIALETKPKPLQSNTGAHLLNHFDSKDEKDNKPTPASSGHPAELKRTFTPTTPPAELKRSWTDSQIEAEQSQTLIEEDEETKAEAKRPDTCLTPDETARRETSTISTQIDQLQDKISDEYKRNRGFDFRRNILQTLYHEIKSEKQAYIDGRAKYDSTDADATICATVKSILDDYLNRPLLDIFAAGQHHKKWYTRFCRWLRDGFVRAFNRTPKPDSLGFFATSYSKKLLTLKADYARVTEAEAKTLQQRKLGSDS